MKPIGKFIIIENINGKEFNSGMEIFDDSKVKILKKSEGSSVIVCEDEAWRFLSRLKWMYDYANFQKVDELMKMWRR